MSPEEQARAARFMSARKGRGFTFESLAEATGMAGATIHSYEGKGKIPGADKALRICKVLQLDMDWWINGTEPSEEAGQVAVDNEPVGVVNIPFYGSDGSQALQYPASLLGLLNVPFEHLNCMFASGVFMAPTIPDGAELVFSSDVIMPRDGRVHLISANGVPVLRRLRIRINGEIEAICDNPAFASSVDLVSPDNVIGEVLWVAHKP